jgi:hypothetical protein
MRGHKGLSYNNDCLQQAIPIPTPSNSTGIPADDCSHMDIHSDKSKHDFNDITCVFSSGNIL